MPLSIIRNDITKMKVDAIVNAANTRLQMGGGVCGAIFYAAGPPKLQTACDRLSPIKTGEAVITDGFALPARYVIHTAGPIYKGGNYDEEEQLRSCYTNSLELAAKNGCASIAFPLISSGIFGYPKDEALTVAISTIVCWLSKNDGDMDVYIVVFDKSSFMLSQELHHETAVFIKENFVNERSASQEIVDPGEPFSPVLLTLIEKKGITAAGICVRANMRRNMFSKIQDPCFRPGRETVFALAVALELTLGETAGLLKRAGFALSKGILSDVIIEFFITRGRYDIYEINNVLFEYDQPILGG